MALDYVTLSQNMTNMYNTIKNDKQQDNPNQVPYTKDPVDYWMEQYITFYDNDANNGVFSLASVVMVSDPESVRFDNLTVSCNGDNMMGAKISDYWSAQLTFGTPQVGVSIVSITNDASKIRAPIENYLCNYPGGVESTPYYEHIFQFIENQVKSIIWTVTEYNGTSNESYSVSIS